MPATLKVTQESSLNPAGIMRGTFDVVVDGKGAGPVRWHEATEVPVEPGHHPASPSPDQRFWLVRELQESLEKAAHRAPLLVVVDDLRWVDAASASALVALSSRPATHRIS